MAVGKERSGGIWCGQMVLQSPPLAAGRTGAWGVPPAGRDLGWMGRQTEKLECKTGCLSKAEKATR